MKFNFLALVFCIASAGVAQAELPTNIGLESNQANPVTQVVRHRQFKESLALAQRHWNQFRPAKYKFRFQKQCFCRDTEPKMIYVQNRMVTKVVDIATDQEVDKTTYVNYTVDGVFNSINKFLRGNPYRVTGAFDAVTGMPVAFWVDVDQRMADEELGYALGDLEKIN